MDKEVFKRKHPNEKFHIKECLRWTVNQCPSTFSAIKTFNMNLSSAVIILAAAMVASGPVMAATTTATTSCKVVKDGTRSCSGALGQSCSDGVNLMFQVKLTKNQSVLVCNGTSTYSVSKKVTLFINNGVRFNSNSCFFIPAAETRTCDDLSIDAAYPKKSCDDQATLFSILIGNSALATCMWVDVEWKVLDSLWMNGRL